MVCPLKAQYIGSKKDIPEENNQHVMKKLRGWEDKLDIDKSVRMFSLSNCLDPWQFFKHLKNIKFITFTSGMKDPDLGSPAQESQDMQERVQQRSAKMMRGLESLSDKGRMRELSERIVSFWSKNELAKQGAHQC